MVSRTTSTHVERSRPASDIEPRRFPPTELLAVLDQHYEPLLRLAYTLTRNQHDAEELVQEAFLSLQERWTSVLNPVAYLRSIVVNGARRQGQRRANRRRIINMNLATVARPGASVDPVEHYLTDALARLPERNRIAIVLAYFAELTSDEIAEVLDCRPSTARSLVKRGLARLRKVLET